MSSMKNNETLLMSQDYDVGGIVDFNLYRYEENGQVEVALKYKFRDPAAAEITCKRIFFPVQAEAFKSPCLSWYNLICCSNNYGPIPVVPYMNHAVQNGKKIAATVYPESYTDYLDIMSECGNDYHCFPFNVMEYQYMLYVSRLGTLADYFALDELLQVYKSCGINLDENKMRDYFSKELSWFGKEECPIEIHNCLGDEELAAVGLLFGYPAESTIALINKTIDMCE